MTCEVCGLGPAPEDGGVLEAVESRIAQLREKRDESEFSERFRYDYAASELNKVASMLRHHSTPDSATTPAKGTPQKSAVLEARAMDWGSADRPTSREAINDATRTTGATTDDRDHGCLCHGCGRRYLVDLWLDDDVWQKIEGTAELLCGQCIVSRLEACGFGVFDLTRRHSTPDSTPAAEWVAKLDEMISEVVCAAYSDGQASMSDDSRDTATCRANLRAHVLRTRAHQGSRGEHG